LGGAPTSLKDVAAAVKKLIPDAEITFGDEPENCELPWLVNCDLEGGLRLDAVVAG
jgi:hypothetical protein